MADLPDYWPKAVAHLGNPLSVDDSEEITVAEIREAPVNGYHGFRKATTALVPLERLNEVLKHPSSMGHEVQSWRPKPGVRESQTYSTRFWIDGREGTDERFETLVQAWIRHNRLVAGWPVQCCVPYGRDSNRTAEYGTTRHARQSHLKAHPCP
jgi:hypothetical protein